MTSDAQKNIFWAEAKTSTLKKFSPKSENNSIRFFSFEIQEKLPMDSGPFLQKNNWSKSGEEKHLWEEIFATKLTIKRYSLSVELRRQVSYSSWRLHDMEAGFNFVHFWPLVWCLLLTWAQTNSAFLKLCLAVAVHVCSM